MKPINNLYKIGITLLVVCQMAPFTIATVNHHSKHGFVPIGAAATNADLQQDQLKQSTLAPEGPVNSSPQVLVNPAQFRTNIKMANQALQVAGQQIQERQDSHTPKGLISNGVKVVKGNSGYIIESLFLLLLGLGAVFAIKYWADHNIPQAPPSHTKKQSW